MTSILWKVYSNKLKNQEKVLSNPKTFVYDLKDISFSTTSTILLSDKFFQYIEDDLEVPTCQYCGNESGIHDTKGNCVSCGAPLKNGR